MSNEESLSAQVEAYLRQEQKRKFSSENRRTIGNKGWVIQGLTGASYARLKAENSDFLDAWDPSGDWGQYFFHDVETEVEPKEVAYNPTWALLPFTNTLDFKSQMERVDSLSTSLRDILPNTKLIIGSFRDYLELDIMRVRSTGQRLLGPDQKIRTTTYTGSIEALDFDYYVAYCDSPTELPKRIGYDDVWVMPLIVQETG